MTSRPIGQDRPPEERRTYMEEILLLQMGGTIDKDYPKTRKGYAFEIEGAASRRVLSRLRPGKSILVVHNTVCRKDSLEIGDQERAKLLEMTLAAPQRRVLVTHGTDTLLQTALWLQQQLQNYIGSQSRLVVFTGAFTPERMRDSDADFNIGVALGSLQSLPNSGNTRIYVAMNGLVCPCEAMERDLDTGQFIPRRRPRSRDFSQRPRSTEVKLRQSADKLTPPEAKPRASPEQSAPEAPPRTRERSYTRQRSLESLLDPRADSPDDGGTEDIQKSLPTSSSEYLERPPSSNENPILPRRAAPSIDRIRHLYNRPLSDGWEPREEVKRRHPGFRASLDTSRYSKLFENPLNLPEERFGDTGVTSRSAQDLIRHRLADLRQSDARSVNPDDLVGWRHSRQRTVRRDPYRDSLGSRSDSGLYTPSHDDILESQLSQVSYPSADSQHLRQPRITTSNCLRVPTSVSRSTHGNTPPPLPLTSPPAILPSPPPPTAEEAEAVFNASLQYLLNQRAQSFPLLQPAPPIPPRPAKFSSTAHAPRREPEINSDPSLPQDTPPTRRSAVRTNGSLVVTSTSDTTNHSPLRRCTAVSQLDVKTEPRSYDNEEDEANDDDSSDDNKAHTPADTRDESPLVAEQRTGARRTLPPGWRHLSQMALADVAEEEEHHGRLGSRSMLRRLSEGTGMQLKENINEEYL